MEAVTLARFKHADVVWLAMNQSCKVENGSRRHKLHKVAFKEEGVYEKHIL